MKLWRRKDKKLTDDEITLPDDELQAEASETLGSHDEPSDHGLPLSDSTEAPGESMFASDTLGGLADSTDVEWDQDSEATAGFAAGGSPSSGEEPRDAAVGGLMGTSLSDDPLESVSAGDALDEVVLDPPLGDSAPDDTGGAGDVDDPAAAEALDGTSSESVSDELDDDEAIEGLEGDKASGTPEGVSGSAGKLTGVRSLAQFSVDTNKLRNLWRGNSVGRTALVAVIVYMLVVGSALYFIVQPASKRLHEVRGQKDILHDYMVVQQAGAAIGSFKDGLMTGDQRLTVMSEVTQMAETSGVRAIGDPELLLGRDAPGSFSEYPMRIRVKGTFHEIGDFLSLLESSSRFAVVEEVEIRSDVASRSSESETTVLLALAAWEG